PSVGRFEAELGAPAVSVLTEPRRRLVGRRGAERVRGLGEGRNRPRRDVLAVEDREPLVEGPRPEDRLELRMCIVLAREEVRPVEQLAKAAPELRLERCDGEEAAVCALVDAVTRELARARAR